MIVILCMENFEFRYLRINVVKEKKKIEIFFWKEDIDFVFTCSN